MFIDLLKFLIERLSNFHPRSPYAVVHIQMLNSIYNMWNACPDLVYDLYTATGTCNLQSVVGVSGLAHCGCRRSPQCPCRLRLHQTRASQTAREKGRKVQPERPSLRLHIPLKLQDLPIPERRTPTLYPGITKQFPNAVSP